MAISRGHVKSLGYVTQHFGREGLPPGTSVDVSGRELLMAATIRPREEPVNRFPSVSDYLSGVGRIRQNLCAWEFRMIKHTSIAQRRRRRSSTRGCKPRPDLILKPIERSVHFLINSFDHGSTSRIGRTADIALDVIEQSLIVF